MTREVKSRPAQLAQPNQADRSFDLTGGCRVKSFAFYGRVSSDDAQDPSLSIPRQLSACERAVAASGGEIVCCYWDIESGRKALEDRGQGSSSWREMVAVPCAGGLPELLAAAYHENRFTRSSLRASTVYRG